MTSVAELDAAAQALPDQVIGERIVEVSDHIEQLVPGEVQPYTLRVPRRFLGRTEGVHWLGVHALGENVDGRDDRADGRARTFIPLVDDGRPALPTALVLQLRKRIVYTADGRVDQPARWAVDLAPGGRLSTVLEMGVEAGSRPMTWLMDPAVIAAVNSLVAGNPVPDAAGTGTRRGGRGARADGVAVGDDRHRRGPDGPDGPRGRGRGRRPGAGVAGPAPRGAGRQAAADAAVRRRRRVRGQPARPRAPDRRAHHVPDRDGRARAHRQPGDRLPQRVHQPPGDPRRRPRHHGAGHQRRRRDRRPDARGRRRARGGADLGDRHRRRPRAGRPAGHRRGAAADPQRGRRPRCSSPGKEPLVVTLPTDWAPLDIRGFYTGLDVDWIDLSRVSDLTDSVVEAPEPVPRRTSSTRSSSRTSSSTRPTSTRPRS